MATRTFCIRSCLKTLNKNVESHSLLLEAESYDLTKYRLGGNGNIEK